MTRKIIFIGLILVAFNPIFIEAQNPCAWVFNGKVPHPDPKRCNEYYSCTLFIGSLRNCGFHEIFDADLRTCIPGDPSTCSSEIPTTENIQTTTELNLAEICDGVFFGARPHPSSNSLFIGCIRGDGMIMTCLDREIFDHNLLKCVPDICEVPIDICADTRLEVAANPCHCDRFIVCYLGRIKEERECGIGLIFDKYRNECVPGNRETCDLYPGITESTSSSSTSSTFSQTTTTLSITTTSMPITSTTSSWSSPCDGILLGNQPNQSNCTLFYRCVNGVPFPQECPVGMIFSKELSQCVVGNASECDLKR